MVDKLTLNEDLFEASIKEGWESIDGLKFTRTGVHGEKLDDDWIDYGDYLVNKNRLQDEMLRDFKEENGYTRADEDRDEFWDEFDEFIAERGLEYLDKTVNESLNEDSVSALQESSDETPETPEANGIAKLILDAINDESDTIKMYNDLIANTDNEDIIQIIQDITAEENNHIGMLQKALEIVSPNASNIEDGVEEAEGMIDDNELVDEDYQAPSVNALGTMNPSKLARVEHRRDMLWDKEDRGILTDEEAEELKNLTNKINAHYAKKRYLTKNKQVDESTLKSNAKTLKEGTAKKRIASYKEFDNGHIIYSMQEMSDDEAEEAAKKASIKDPTDIYYVKYDDVMNPSSDLRWYQGESYDINKYDIKYEEGTPVFIPNEKTEESLNEGFWFGKYKDTNNKIHKVYFDFDSDDFDRAEKEFNGIIPDAYVKAKLYGRSLEQPLIRDGFVKIGECLKEDLHDKFKRDIKKAYKDWAAANERNEQKRREAQDFIPETATDEQIAKYNAWINKEYPQVEFKYDFPKNIEKDDYPFYVTYYAEYPIYEPAEGGYYYPGRDAIYSKGFNTEEEAIEFMRNEIANDDYIDNWEEYSDGYISHGDYIGEDQMIVIEPKNAYLSQIAGWEPYQ